MNLSDSSSIILFHRARVRQCGSGTPGALGWSSEENQQLRFGALADIADMSGKTVLDIGCGHGDLALYLTRRYNDITYKGIDHAPAFLEIAVRRYGDLSGISFMLADFWSAAIPQTDYVLASGALNYRHSDEGFVFEMIDKLFAACRMGLAFNLLSKAERVDGVLVAYDPQEILAQCNKLTDKVQLVEGYLPNDFTIYLYR